MQNTRRIKIKNSLATTPGTLILATVNEKVVIKLKSDKEPENYQDYLTLSSVSN